MVASVEGILRHFQRAHKLSLFSEGYCRYRFNTRPPERARVEWRNAILSMKLFPGLAITPSGESYSVTHVGTGYAVLQHLTVPEAISAALKLSCFCNWADICTPDDVPEACAQFAKQYQEVLSDALETMEALDEMRFAERKT